MAVGGWVFYSRNVMFFRTPSIKFLGALDGEQLLVVEGSGCQLVSDNVD